MVTPHSNNEVTVTLTQAELEEILTNGIAAALAATENRWNKHNRNGGINGTNPKISAYGNSMAGNPSSYVNSGMTIGEPRNNKRKGNEVSRGAPDPRPEKRSTIVTVNSSRRKKGASNGPHPLCTRCEQHHPARFCDILCSNCKRKGHIAKNCRRPKAPTISIVKPATGPMSSYECFNCGRIGHKKYDCPELKEAKDKALSRVHTLTVSEIQDCIKTERENGKLPEQVPCAYCGRSQ